ncbi:MAG: hypothetical protein WBV82_23295 [Myxococcaceae bacterium]
MDGTVLHLSPATHVAAERAPAERHLRIYLRDHLALVHGGISLVRRTLGPNRDNAVGQLLSPLHLELLEDRALLLDVGHAVGVTPSPVKMFGAWLGERAGRLKLNGRLRGYSPLSRVVELEGLALLCAARESMWRVLERHARLDPRLDVVNYTFRADLAARRRVELERTLIDASLEAF